MKEKTGHFSHEGELHIVMHEIKNETLDLKWEVVDCDCGYTHPIKNNFVDYNIALVYDAYHTVGYHTLYWSNSKQKLVTFPVCAY